MIRSYEEFRNPRDIQLRFPVPNKETFWPCLCVYYTVASSERVFLRGTGQVLL